MRHLQSHVDLDGIGFWDDFFLGNQDRAKSIIYFLYGEGIKFLCEARAVDLDDDLVGWLKRMGCLPCTAHKGWRAQLAKINPKMYRFIQENYFHQTLLPTSVKGD